MPDTTTIKKTLGARFVQKDAKTKTYTALITTESIDLEGDVIIPDGVDASYMLTYRTVYWGHDYLMPQSSIGKMIALRRVKGGIEADFVLAERPGDFKGDFPADLVRALIDQRIVNGVSVGLDPIETRAPSQKDRERYGEDVKRIIGKWKLLEFSVTPAPMNPQAVIRAMKSGALTAAQCKALGVDATERVRKSIVVKVDRPRPVRKLTVEQRVRRAVKMELARRRGQLWG